MQHFWFYFKKLCFKNRFSGVSESLRSVDDVFFTKSWDQPACGALASPISSSSVMKHSWCVSRIGFYKANREADGGGGFLGVLLVCCGEKWTDSSFDHLQVLLQFGTEHCCNLVPSSCRASLHTQDLTLFQLPGETVCALWRGLSNLLSPAEVLRHLVCWSELLNKVSLLSVCFNSNRTTKL